MNSTILETTRTESTDEVPEVLEDRYEIVDGQRVEMPPMSAYSSFIGSKLAALLNHFALEHQFGQAFSEVLLRLPLDKERQRRPDAAFVSYDQWPKDRPVPEEDNAWPMVPELTIEVISPTDRAEEIFEKVDEYFRAGSRLVWVVYPRHRVICVYTSLVEMRAVREHETIDGGGVLPGFRLALSDLFPPRAAN